MHATLIEWTSKVDTKASIVMTLETAMLGLVLAFSDNAKALGQLHGAALWGYRTGLVCLCASIVMAGVVVFPQMARRRSRATWRDNYIYFGHLRHWRPSALAAEMGKQRGSANLEVLSDQLVQMAQIAWRKHACLQYSMLLVLLAAAALGVTIALR